MDSWIHEMVRKRLRRRVAAWAVVVVCTVAIVVAQHRYLRNFLMGPFTVTQAELDAIDDASTAPRYFVRVTGSRAVNSGVQQVTTHTRGGVETSRSVSANYYILVVGDRLLVAKASEGTPLTAEGALTPMSESLQSHLFDTPRMQAIRPRFYPYYVDDKPFRASGYVGIGALVILAVLLVVYALPAWRYRHDVSAHPLLKRATSWGDLVGSAVEARRESEAPRYKGGGWLVTEKYLIRSTFFVFDVLRLSDLLWGYKKVTKHSVNFVPTGKTYTCVLACHGGSAEITGNEKNVDAILVFAAHRTPWAIFGFSEQLKKLFSKSTQEFAAAVEARKREWASRPQPNP